MAFKRIYSEAHYSLYDYGRNLLANIGFDLLQAARARRFWRCFLSILWYRTAQFWGTYQGYRQSNLLTPDIRHTFYYHIGWKNNAQVKREEEPIRYNEHSGMIERR